MKIFTSIFLGLLCALPCAGVLAAQDEGEPTVKFVQPRHLQTVLGTTVFEAALDLTPGLTVEQMLFTVDGFAVAALDGPPWRIEWDAGESGRGYRLEVIARLSDGSEISQVIATTELRINQREAVDLVSLYPVVRDRSGRYISDLSKDDFLVLENGREQKVTSFTTARRPLRVGIVLDTSLSMNRGERLSAAQSAALRFLDSLQPGDEGMLVTFSDRVRVAQDFTSDRDLLGAAIMATTAHGGTALYDAVWRTSWMLRELDARRVIVLLSDGKDEATSGFEPGSLHTLDEALDQALRNEVMVFSIGLGKALDDCVQDWSQIGNGDGECRDGTLEQALGKMSDVTGGRLLISQSARRLRNAFEDIASDLRNQYSLAYSSTDPNKDGDWRPIELTVKDRPQLRVIARDGYFATSSK